LLYFSPFNHKFAVLTQIDKTIRIYDATDEILKIVIRICREPHCRKTL